jgi:hypothetical protein
MDVEVARLAAVRVDCIEQQVEVPASHRGEPVAASVVETVTGQQSRAEEPQRQHADRRIRDLERFHVDHAAHAVAEVDRITAGVHLDRAHQCRIDRAEDALEILQVERVVQAKPVETHQRLVDVAAADIGLRGEAAGRGTRQPGDGAQRIVTEVGQTLEIIGHEPELLGIGGAQEAVAAAGDEHLLERRGDCRRGASRSAAVPAVGSGDDAGRRTITMRPLAISRASSPCGARISSSMARAVAACGSTATVMSGRTTCEL